MSATHTIVLYSLEADCYSGRAVIVKAYRERATQEYRPDIPVRPDKLGGEHRESL